ncbi:MAG: hypothetical protein H7Y88_06515 [Phycisphaerales bacterium]|nr:hypothetical protein [Phycisphaerales bacterium]
MTEPKKLIASAGPHDDPAVWGPRLSRMLARQCELFCELDGLGEPQRELIGAGDTDGLLRLLAQRQALVDEVTRLSNEIEPFRRQWDELMSRLPDGPRAELEHCVLELRGLVDRVCKRDDADRATLEDRRSAITTELSGVSRGRGAVAAYTGGVAGGGAMYQDRQG